MENFPELVIDKINYAVVIGKYYEALPPVLHPNSRENLC
jgi:hypothetical protein